MDNAEKRSISVAILQPEFLMPVFQLFNTLLVSGDMGDELRKKDISQAKLTGFALQSRCPRR
jgi:hypothetical protein